MAESVTLARQGSWSLADDAQSTDQDPFLVDLNRLYSSSSDCNGRKMLIHVGSSCVDCKLGFKLRLVINIVLDPALHYS